MMTLMQRASDWTQGRVLAAQRYCLLLWVAVQHGWMLHVAVVFGHFQLMCLHLRLHQTQKQQQSRPDYHFSKEHERHQMGNVCLVVSSEAHHLGPR